MAMTPQERKEAARIEDDLRSMALRINETKQKIDVAEQEIRDLQKAMKPKQVAVRRRRLQVLYERLSEKSVTKASTSAALSAAGMSSVASEIDALEREVELLERMNTKEIPGKVQTKRAQIRLEKQVLERLYSKIREKSKRLDRIKLKLGTED
jgi:hypothetical protein